jgi:alanine racemase
MPRSEPADGRAVLSIDLDAVVANYRLIEERLGGIAAAGVVKADAYGLGALAVAPALAAAGCGTFFVAQLAEALRLRPVLGQAAIAVLEGFDAACRADYDTHRLLPVLNHLGQLDDWRRTGGGDAILHLDTGMNRLGLSEGDVERLAQDLSRLERVRLAYIMSHLASAEVPADPQNTEQLQRFHQALRRLPKAKASFANSSGVFLGPDYHFDLARPGAALYGLAPIEGAANPMRTTVRLEAPILQVREVPAGATIGYRAGFRTPRRMRIATLGLGYADGYLRSLANRGLGYIGGRLIPLVGRVSMDLITADVTDVPERDLGPYARVELIGPNLPPDAVAERAGTNGYEILTSLGPRYHRVYTGARHA